jgi:hypothetical protein
VIRLHVSSPPGGQKSLRSSGWLRNMQPGDLLLSCLPSVTRQCAGQEHSSHQTSLPVRDTR